MTDKVTTDPIPAATAVDEKDVNRAERVISHDEAGLKHHIDYDRVDSEVAKYADPNQIVEISPEENSRLRRMIDKRVLFVMVFTYFMQALDKGTLTFASIMGIRQDNDLLNKQRYSWLTTCIYIAILIVEYPINWLITRVPLGKTLGIVIIIWGTVLACHAATTNFPQLVVVRTLLGIFEAFCQPSFVVLSAMWYKREEQAERITFWYMMNGGQQIVGGLLAYCFSLIKPNPTLKSWQALFLTYGVISVLWGFFVLWYMPDSPMRAKCFSEDDKRLMVERVRSNQTGLQNKVFRKEQVFEALSDPQCWCYGGIQLLTTLPTSGLGAFYGIVVTGFHFTVLQTQLLAMVLGAVIIIILLSSTYLAKIWNQTTIIMALYVIPSFMGTIVLMTVKNTTTATKAGLLISYYIALSFWAAQTLTLSLVSRNVGGQTKKSVAITMNFVFWSTGNAIGPQVFLDRDAPRYFTAWSVHMGCYVALVLIIVFLRFYLSSQNKKKDALQEGSDNEGIVHGFDDLTDQKNLHFRYIY